MSYDKDVYPARIPTDLVDAWQREIGRHGLRVTFHPKFDPSAWDGGYLPCRLEVEPGAFPAWERYGPGPVHAGFELYSALSRDEVREVVWELGQDLEAAGEPLPRLLLRRLRNSPALFQLSHGGLRWTAAEFRVCWYAAAALATITDGLLMDEWTAENHGFWSAEEAFRVAAERSAAYEDRAEGDRVWEIPPFESWGS